MNPALVPGVVIAQRYRLTRQIGEGGMGSVWAALHTVTRRQVAIKFPHHSVRSEMRHRFLREARTVSAVDHPNVIRVHDAFELDDGMPIIVMDLLQGETFGALLARKQTLSLSETVRVLLPVVSAVGTAHSFGIVHRDLKPDNVFLAKIGEATVVKVLDFGIAKLISDDGQATTTGSTMGTPCYMSPEQSLGEKNIDHRGDIWSIGAMLYEALSGGRPIEGENVGQVVKRLLTETITPIGAVVPDLPADVRSLVDRMLARNRSDRLADLREAMEVLSHHGEVVVPIFGAPRSQAIPSDSPELSDRDAARSEATRPLTTNAPETLRSSRPAAGRARWRAAALIFASALAIVGLLLAWRTTRGGGTRNSVVSPREPSGGVSAAPGVPSTSETVVAKRSDDANAIAQSAPSPSPQPAASTKTPLPPAMKRRPGNISPAGSAPNIARALSSAPVAPVSTPAVSSHPPRRGLAEDVPF